MSEGEKAMPTILCIDDDPMILELQKGILETNGYTVLTAPDGPTGLTLASKHPVDVVVLDFKMPGMDGGQVAEVLLKEQPNLPVVISTGFFDAVPEWLRWFAAAYLQKGDGPHVLLSAIQDVIAQKKVSGQAPETNRSLRKASAA
jgi:two-component system alkaline phosphatase synthesis response regulator PhoP